ncbi:uncharacterized protein LOC112026446 [Quercus suber]|uniref:uncharacterized protein LOC112026446 n=1 Tax=Quercus suber TaxID=58331 RepID=UPI000CE1DD2A|nr:uncharacterized protein LOC112026446 [Quercus suber]
MANFTPLNTLLDQVLMQIRVDPILAWLDKLKGNPNKRPRNKYCCFHRDHRHDTFECYDLKRQIEALVKQGKLQRFIRRERVGENPLRDLEPNRWVKERLKAPLEEMRVIVGGSTMVWTTSHLPKLTRVDDPTINFTEEDARRLHHPYDNALVIIQSIANFNTRQGLVDNGNSANILYYPAFK